MSDVSSQPNTQLGLLDLNVDLSVPEVYSGSDFTLYLHVKNPFAQPVWIKSVELSLPTQLSVRQLPVRQPIASPVERTKDERPENDFVNAMIREREAEVRQLRQTLRDGEPAADKRAVIERQIIDLESRIWNYMENISGKLVVNAVDDSNVRVGKTHASQLVLNLQDGASARLDDYRGLDFGEAERVPLLGSLPYGSALQPGSTDVWTIRLGSHRTPFFVPAKYKLQLTVIYGLERPPGDQNDDRDLCSNTSSYSLQVRAALWSVILGGVIGGIVGSVARSLQDAGGASAFRGTGANTAVGALLLSAILSGAAIVFSARKSEAQSFVTVEDFWGGLLVGFLIGYSGTTAFAKITGSEL